MNDEPNEQKSQKDINREIYVALFGDPDTGAKGVVAMTKEMYEAWSAVIWLGKIATWVAIILAGVGAAWSIIAGGIKHFITGR